MRQSKEVGSTGTACTRLREGEGGRGREREEVRVSVGDELTQDAGCAMTCDRPAAACIGEHGVEAQAVARPLALQVVEVALRQRRRRCASHVTHVTHITHVTGVTCVTPSMSMTAEATEPDSEFKQRGGSNKRHREEEVAEKVAEEEEGGVDDFAAVGVGRDGGQRLGDNGPDRASFNCAHSCL